MMKKAKLDKNNFKFKFDLNFFTVVFLILIIFASAFALAKIDNYLTEKFKLNDNSNSFLDSVSENISNGS